MPHINKVRLVNVNFNDAKGIYDDFIMNLNGKSTTYDLMNTGGKSLLLLMMLQTVLPNTYLKANKPVKNIFIGGNTKRTSHCLIEWILDEGYEYQYMLTGFCARKKQNSEENELNPDNKLEIDYYNYCYFYNKDNRTNIKTLPLVKTDNNEKIYMSYDKLRQLLNSLKREGEQIEIFDSKKDYMKYIEYYGLISAEWKLISEINVSENYIEKYFKENKTSRKLIENFLIRIIDNINEQNKDDKEPKNQLAETLIKLKENLMEFRKKSDNKNEYLQTKELYQNLQSKNNNLLEKYTDVNKIYKKAYEAYCVQKREKEILSAKIQNEREKIEELKTQNNQMENQNSKLKIDKLYYERNQIEKEKINLEDEKEKTKELLEGAISSLELAKAQNEYIEYEEEKKELDKLQIQIENLSIGETDIQKNYQKYTYNYKIMLNQKIEELSSKLENYKNESKQKEEAKNISKTYESNARENLTKCRIKIENLEKQLSEIQENIEEIDQEFTFNGKMDVLLNKKESLDIKKDELENLQNQKEENISKRENLNLDIIQKTEKIMQIKANKTIIENNLENARNNVDEYETKKKSIESLAKAFQNSETLEKLKEKLENELQEREKYKNSKQIAKQIKSRKLELMEKYQMVVPNEEIIHLKEQLETKCTYVATGIEKLMLMKEQERKELLSKNPLFIYSVFVDETSFQKIRNKQFEMEIENLVPIVSIELLRSNKEYSLNEIIFPIQKNVYESLEQENFNYYKQKLNNAIIKLEEEIQQIKKKENEVKSYLDQTNYFITTYTNEKVENLLQELKNAEENLKNAENEIKNYNKKIQNNKEEIENLKKLESDLIKKEEELQSEIKLLEELLNLEKEKTKLKEDKIKTLEDEKSYNEILQEKIEQVNNLEYECTILRDKIYDTDNQKQNNISKYKVLPECKQTEILQENFEEIENHYEALWERLKNSNSQLSNLQKFQQLHKTAMEKCEKTIKENNYTIEYFIASNEQFEKILESQIEEKILKKQEIAQLYKKISIKCEEKRSEYDQIKGKIKILLEELSVKGQIYNESERIEELEKIEKNLKDNTTIIKINKKEIVELNNRIQNVEEQIKNVDKEYNSIEAFIEDKQIEPFNVDAENILKGEVYSYQKIRTESSKLNAVISKSQNEFTNYISHIKENVENFYIKQDVIDVLKEIKVPFKLEECNQVENGISIIIEQLEEKIRHIEEALKNLEGYQQNFITKCSEKAETIVRDLEKLPGLSKIKIGGKDINIIKLDLYEYEKEDQKKRMEDYIYKIVEEMETKPDEMTKEQLNERLSSKSLVAQIINLDKASVKLYKIEDIQEHSTYKRWEDDLGSDGQVNAIYFMFAVCIISYISMLTRKEASSKTKKVIIVDNPFGATSAVFLWNVMFSILKENNVQLIAPGHNINKEIISKFEVNYVLKHDYYNGNRKSVVVDKELRTEDDLDSMNFEIIEGNQTSMF